MMGDMPLISVIVPVYKVEAYLARCIESIIRQTYENIEIILVDDGSPDRCGMICDEYAKKDHRIRVIHKENGGPGPSTARNAGLDAARGVYISFVDPDDCMHPKMLETLYAAMDCREDVIVVCKYYLLPDTAADEYDKFFRQKEENSERKISSPEEFMEYAITSREYQSVLWNKLFPEKLFQEGSVRFVEGVFHEDIMVAVQLILNAREIVEISDHLYVYTQRECSTMHSFSAKRSSDALDAYIFETACLKKYGAKGISRKMALYKLDQIVFRYIDYKENYPEDLSIRKMVHKKYKKMYWQAFSYLTFKEKIDRFLYYISPELHEKIYPHKEQKN